MDELEVKTVRIVATAVTIVLCVITFSCTAYNIVDRMETGHVAYSTQQVVTQTK